MNEILCKLTGGHRYRDKDLKVFEDNYGRRMIFCNICEKCGKKREWSVPYNKLFNERELDLLGLKELKQKLK